MQRGSMLCPQIPLLLSDYSLCMLETLCSFLQHMPTHRLQIKLLSTSLTWRAMLLLLMHNVHKAMCRKRCDALQPDSICRQLCQSVAFSNLGLRRGSTPNMQFSTSSISMWP